MEEIDPAPRNGEICRLHLSGGLVWILLIGYLATGPTVMPPPPSWLTAITYRAFSPPSITQETGAYYLVRLDQELSHYLLEKHKVKA